MAIGDCGHESNDLDESGIQDNYPSPTEVDSGISNYPLLKNLMVYSVKILGSPHNNHW